MNIQGLQKLTLLDYPGKVACTVFAGGCNFRCPFCHNGDLVLRPNGYDGMTEEEFLAFLKKRAGVLDGVCVSGGEPTLQPDLPEFLARIRDLGYLIKLDTNGSTPEILRNLCENHLVDAVAMDVKNCRERYAETIGMPPDYDLSPIEESVEYLKSGRVSWEFRTTVARELHRPEDLVSLAQWLQGDSKYFLQAFVSSEYVLDQRLTAPSREEMQTLLNAVLPWLPNARVRGE